MNQEGAALDPGSAGAWIPDIQPPNGENPLRLWCLRTESRDPEGQTTFTGGSESTCPRRQVHREVEPILDRSMRRHLRIAWGRPGV